MKFSYNLLKKYLPDLESKEQAIEALTMHSFETEDRGGDTIDVSVSTNRYSDAASHIGIAKELAVVLDLDDSNIPEIVSSGDNLKMDQEVPVDVNVKKEDLCPRYLAGYFEDVEIKESPDWLKEILKDCGLRPINNVVDIMNYAMLETGQPLHAFDLEKIGGKEINVRLGKDDEDFVSIDDNPYDLDSDILTIADDSKPMAIAGIKGGKNSAVSKDTKNIIVEAASFDGVLIYKTSKNIGLDTDASLRFAHNIHSSLPLAGLDRARELLEEVVGATFVSAHDSNKQEYSNRHLSFDIDDFNKFIGSDISEKQAKQNLEKLGFDWNGGKVEIPVLRQDIKSKEDLYEEVIRLEGLDDLEPKAPFIGIQKQKQDDVFIFRDEIRDILSGLGYDEVYNYSFIGESGEGKVKIANPVSEQKDHLRDSLLPLITSNVEDNFRFFDEVRVFEVGNVFETDNKEGVKERPMIGIGVGIQEGKNNAFFELKGVVEELFNQFGLTDYLLPEADDFHGTRIESDGEVIGSVVRINEETAVAEIEFSKLLESVEEEISYEPIPEYPAVSRDVSLIVDPKTRIGTVIQEIQNINFDLIRDVDLIDEYFGDDGTRQSITLRVVFQSDEKTLESDEVDDEMEKITDMLEEKFEAEIR